MSSWFTNTFAEEIWRTKYAGEFEDVEEYYHHLANLVAENEEQEQAFFELMWEKKFSPGGRILAYAGRPNARMSLMNCTTYSIQDDSLEGISKAAYKIMRASSRGQGIGIDLSELRPRGAPVNNAALTSTGAISFMEMLNTVGETIGQEGRRAALLFSLRVDHPDLWRPDGYDFLNIKKTSGKVENANISVIVTDDFMESVLDESMMWEFEFFGESGGEYFEAIKSGYTAENILYEIAKSAWASAEPGLLMWDVSKRFSNSDLFGYPIVGVNACTEQILDQEGVCNLGSMNIAAYVDNPFTKNASFNYVNFVIDIQKAVRFLDNVLDLELESGGIISEKQEESIIMLRRIGLGVMGLADALAAMGILYGDNQEAMYFIDQVFKYLRDGSYAASSMLAREKGPAPVWTELDMLQRKDILKKGFFATLPEAIKQVIVSSGGLRNITLLSIAPTGSISNLLGVSSGIEPLFAKEYTRLTRMNGDEEYIDYIHPGVLNSRILGLDDSIWPTAYEIDPMEHIAIQALAQKYVDQSISKTINLPKESTVGDIMEIYMEAWKRGLKGITVYRDGSREKQVLSAKEGDVCPVCGNGIIYRDGCRECRSCSWSVCEV